MAERPWPLGLRALNPALSFVSVRQSKCCSVHNCVAEATARRPLGDQNGLAAGLLDGFLRGLRELVRVNGDRARERAVIEHLDEAVLLTEQAKRDDLVERELGAGLLGEDLRHAVEADDGVLGAEDVIEATLGKAAVQRHLAAFKTAHEGRTGARALALVAAGRGLAHSRAHTAADALLVFIRLLGRAEIGEIADCHCVPRYNAGEQYGNSRPTRM